MQSSVVFPKHRRKGLYTRMLNEMIVKVKNLGFIEIYSRHAINDNPILISKLKAGFVISSTEISPVFGTLLHLSYYLDDKSRKLVGYRTGMIVPDDEIMNLLKK